MSRPERYRQYHCTEPGCKECGHYSYRTNADWARLPATWTCARHSHKDELLSADSPRKQATLTNVEKEHGKFWNGRRGFVYGDGFRAFAEDFPAGTKLIITAELVMPESGTAANNEGTAKYQKAVSEDAAIPEGFRLVPIEPTQAMLDAFDERDALHYNPANKRQQYKAKHTWKAMLTAAPEVPKTQLGNLDKPQNSLGNDGKAE